MAPVTEARDRCPRYWLKPFARARLWLCLWGLGIAAVTYFSIAAPQDLPPITYGSDKLHHFLAYLLLAASAVQLFRRWAGLLLVCLALVLLGVLLEVVQGYAGLGRTMDARDALANSVGVLAGLATVIIPQRDLLLRLDLRVWGSARE